MKKLFLKLVDTLFYLVSKGYSQVDISTTTNWYNRANYNPASIAKEELNNDVIKRLS